MGLVYRAEGVKVFEADCLELLRALPDNSIDSFVTDPPYGLSNTTPELVKLALWEWTTVGDREFTPPVKGGGFMGKTWDSFVPPPAVWDEVLRVLKPGGHLLCFAGARTQDIMGVSIRLAGFEIRDSIAWMYGGGMPKAKGVLKPAFEPIIVARKPFKGSEKANVEKHGTGPLQVEVSRIPHRNEADLLESTQKNRHADFGTEPGRNNVYGDYTMVEVKNYEGAAGRHPANVLLDESQADALDEQSGITRSRKGKPRRSKESGEGWGMTHVGAEYDDIGGASRFFYVSRAANTERVTVDGVSHPTVKPLDLMRYLVKLATPAGGIIVDPFAGSGTTVEAAILEGFKVVAVEQEPTYLPLIIARIERATEKDS